MTDDIPQWAKERACELINVDGSTYEPGEFTPDSVGLTSIGTAFARYIAEHEEAPVDPDVAAVRRILSAAKAAKSKSTATNVAFFASGAADNTPYFQAALAAYREVRHA